LRCIPFAAYVPLVAHVTPTLLIGYGLVIPRSCIAGVNELTIGFAASVLGTCLAYVTGLHVAARVSGSCDRAPS
jgi:hypothetical protein